MNDRDILYLPPTFGILAACSTPLFISNAIFAEKKEDKPRRYGDKLRVKEDGSGTFNLRPFFSWHIMELCFDRRYEMIGPHKEDMLTFKFAVCGPECHKKMDSKLADIQSSHWNEVEKSLQKAGLKTQY